MDNTGQTSIMGADSAHHTTKMAVHGCSLMFWFPTLLGDSTATKHTITPFSTLMTTQPLKGTCNTLAL